MVLRIKIEGQLGEQIHHQRYDPVCEGDPPLQRLYNIARELNSSHFKRGLKARGL